MNVPRPSLVRGSMLIASSLAAAGTLAFIISIVVAREVGVTEFGYYSITISLQNIAILFSSFSIGMAVTKFVAEYAVRDSAVALRFARAGLQLVLLFASLTAVVYFVLADLLGNGLYDEPEVADLIPYSATVAFSHAILILMLGIAQGNHRMKLMAAMQVSAPVISLSVILLGLPSLGVRAAFIAFFVAQITVSSASLVWLARTGFPVIGRVGKADGAPCFRKLLSFAVPSVISAALVTPVFWFGNTVLTLESGFAAMGYFGVALVFFQGLNMLAGAVAVPMVPRVSEMSVRLMDSIESLVSRAVRAVSFLFFPLFFAVALFCREIIGFLYGSDFEQSSDAAYLVVAACYYCAVGTPIGATITGLGRMWVALALNAFWAAVFVAMVILLVPSDGIAGLGMAFVLSYGAHVGTSVAVSNRVLRMRIRGILVGIIPSTVFFAAGYLVLIDEELDSLLAKVLLLAAGGMLMAYLGRSDYRLVLNRIFGR